MIHKLLKNITLVMLITLMLAGVSSPSMAATNGSNIHNQNNELTNQEKTSQKLNQETNHLLKNNLPLNLQAKSALAIDAKTGQILYDKNSKQSLPTASMSKLLSIYVTLKAIKNHQINWDTKVKITPALHALSVNPEYANVELRENHTYTIEQLYKAAIYSENAGAMAMGYGVAGSTQKFALAMRKAAKDLGINDAQIYTACGLTNGEVGSLGFSNVDANAENKLSARDMAVISMNILKLYPHILKDTAANTTKFENNTMLNWNWMIRGRSEALPDIKVDGLKTGTSDTAGACFTGTAVKDNHRVITVVMGVHHAGQYDPSRFVQTQKLLKYVYAKYRYVSLNAHQPVSEMTEGRNEGTLDVPNGKQTKVSLGFSDHQDIWLSNVQQFQLSQITPLKSVEYDGGLNAPITAGDVVANAKVIGLNYINNENNLKLTALNDDDKANIFVRMWRSILSWL
ncbi:D-alanyl-D-alanine carboxypeptidase [Apilactobacillus apisilvae]|uniref:D-alanyl-D-alanine carboxypeptidase n=1 Tax=Apilactobacillus apisilvae TaxID=2923364 RepID=A0ABY4PGM9_9LACO|nr:serine hydrolase [Apilactobacillus apisilvae]UQS84964.1 D-alanyl-D-alanine carboxypeptidase [Apilactobacillus apisilvae]